MVRKCHLSGFSHVSEIGVTNSRVPFVSGRTVAGFLSGLVTLIRRAGRLRESNTEAARVKGSMTH